MNGPVLILASGSPRRQELIRTFGLAWTIDPADIDESMPEGTPPHELVEQLSVRKAHAVASRSAHPGGSVVIGSDTVVVLDGRVLGKPGDEADAFDMLRALSGRTHQVYTGLACIGVGRETTLTGDKFAPAAIQLSADELIQRYMAVNRPVNGAGTGEGDGDVIRHGDIGQYRVISALPDGPPTLLVGHTVSKVTFSPMRDEEIRAYIETGEPLDKAGSYGVQGMGAVFVENIEGDYYSIMGLPLNLLYRMLLHFDIRPL